MAKLLRLRAALTTAFGLSLLLQIVAGVTEVVLDVPETPVQEGEAVVIKCTVTEKSSYNVYIKRYGVEDNEEFLVVNNRATALLPRNIMVDINDDPPNDMFMVTLTLTVNRTDAQTYKCWAGSSPSHEDIIAKDSGDLIVHYVPGIRYPVCEISSTDQGLVRPAGSDIILDCTSEKGNPSVALQWTGPNNNVISPIEFETTTTKTTRIIVTLSNSHDGAVFTCGIIRMPGRTCNIGPVEISGSVANSAASGSSYNPGMVVALAILSVVIVIVVAVIVIAVLIQCRQCACDYFNNYSAQPDDSRDIEMHIEDVSKPKKKRRKRRSRSKNNNNDGNDVEYEIEHVPMMDIYPLNPQSDPESGENVYSKEVEIDSESVTSNGKVYPPPPTYPSDDTESKKKFKIPRKIPMDDELSVSSQSSDSSSHTVQTIQNHAKEAELPISNEVALLSEVHLTDGVTQIEEEAPEETSQKVDEQSIEANAIVLDVAVA